MDAVLFCAGGEDDAFEMLVGAGLVECLEEVFEHGAIDVPIFLFSVLLKIGGEKDVFCLYSLKLLCHRLRI